MHPAFRWLAAGFVRPPMRRKLAELLAATARPREVQREVLTNLLSLNHDSAFARIHGFSQIRSVEDFRRQVPVADYEYYRPYVDRMKQGETAALVGSRQKLLMFTLTSGTTSESKFIPITDRFVADYRRGWTMWGIRAYDEIPPLGYRDIVQLSSDYDQFRTPGGHPCGNISGLVAQMQSAIVKTMYVVPDLVSKIGQADAKYYTALRLSVANRNVGMVMTANPSTLVHLAKFCDQQRDSLIRDVAEGTLSSEFDVAAPIRHALRRRIARANRRRAAELEQIVTRTGHLYPQDIWPKLSLLAVWTGGSARAYVRNLPQFYGGVPVRDHGLSASEGRMTIPLWNQRSDGVLEITTHFFEFIPEEEYGSSQHTVLEAHELAEGKNYYILLTTSSGLCRYNIRDVVRCTGFQGKTPLLEFLNKGAHISSLTGEKISESQVVAAVDEALAGLSFQLSYYTVAPRWGDPPGYEILIEQREVPGVEAARKLAEAVDVNLGRINCEYGDKRKSGRLAPLVPHLLPDGTWQAFTRKRQSKLGGSVEQYKHPCLSPDTQYVSQVTGAV